MDQIRLNHDACSSRRTGVGLPPARPVANIPAMPMDHDTRRIVRTALALLASVMLLLAVGVIAITLRLNPADGQPVDYKSAVIGVTAYVVIAALCFYAIRKIKPAERP